MQKWEGVYVERNMEDIERMDMRLHMNVCHNILQHHLLPIKHQHQYQQLNNNTLET